jgi:predicted amidohydrolase
MIDKIRVGIVQLEIEHDFSGIDCRERNMEKICTVISQMAVHNPNLIVLPDEFYTGSAYGQFSPVDSLEEIETNVFSKLKKLAEKHKIIIAGGLITLINDEDLKASHLGFIINEKGEILDFQEKMHLVKSEQLFIKTGNEFKVFDTSIGKIGLLVSNDILFPEIARKFALQGAEILIAPILAPGLKEDQKIFNKYDFPINLYKYCSIARAFENQIFTILVNSIGKYPHIDLQNGGNSTISGPLGLIYDSDNNKDYAIIDVNKVHIEEAKKFLNLMEMRNNEHCKIN